MFLLLSIIFLVASSSLAASLPKHNISIAVPEGFSNHGNQDLFCVPTKWYRVLLFYAINYVAHAVTVKSKPGQTWLHDTYDALLALAFPYTGLWKAFVALSRYPRPREHEIASVIRAEALFVVKRPISPWSTYLRANQTLSEGSRSREPSTTGRDAQNPNDESETHTSQIRGPIQDPSDDAELQHHNDQ